LVVTNDLPPKVGGVQTFVHELVRRLPAERVTVLAPAADDAGSFDAQQGFRIERERATFLWPTPGLRRRVLDLAAASGSEVILFGSPVPLAGIGPGLAAAGLPYVTLAHGFEYWMSLAPGARAFLRRATSRASAVLACSRFVGRVVRTAVPEQVPVRVLVPGVDPGRFHPGVDPDPLRDELGIADVPTVVCVSRLVARKGQDVLIRGIERIRRRIPNATLVIVGDGDDRSRLERLASRAPARSVVFAGQLEAERLPEAYVLADVFAMPCRDRLAGLEIEGFGIVFAEAAACAVPAVAGDSGGASEAVVDGETGVVVDGRDVAAVADAISGLLADPDRARRLGAAGRGRVEDELSWEHVTARLVACLRSAAESRFSGPARSAG
jgi:phosphatidylinositol alpha-1,6-mannosyltransferase